MDRHTTCEQCGAEVPVKQHGGTPRRYCGGKCRQAALRARQAAQYSWASADLRPAQLSTVEPAPPRRQVPARAVDDEVELLGECRVLERRWRSVGEARADGLGMRSLRMADGLRRLLDDLFGGV